MRKRAYRAAAAMMAAVAVVLALASVAAAANPPNWVALIYVEAQKAIGLRWSPVPGATAYKVLRSTTAGTDYKEVASVAAPQYFDKEIEPGATYYYTLQTVAGAETSPSSQERSVAIPGEKKVEVMQAPVWDNVKVTSSVEFGKANHKVGLFWKGVAGNVAAYNVYRSEVPGKDYQLIVSQRETQVVDANVVEGKTYYYVLTALDAATLMETPYSAEKSAKIEAVAIAARAAAPKKEKIIQHFRVSKLLWTASKGEWGSLGGASDVAVSDKEIFVSAFEAKQIHVLNRADGSYARSIGGKSAAFKGLQDPKGIHYDADDERLYVADARASAVYVFNAENGEFVEEWPMSKEHGTDHGDEQYKKDLEKMWTSPADVAVTSDGEVVVIDNGRSKVLVYDKRGKWLRELSIPVGRPEPGSFSFPSRCVINQSKEHKGDLLVVDTFGARVQVYDFATEQWRAFGQLGEVAGSFKTAMGIDVDPTTNKIYVGDKDNSVVTEFDYDGKYLTMIGDNKKNEKGNFMQLVGTVTGVAVDGGTQTIYVSDYYGGKVRAFKMTDEVFTPEGQ